MTERRGGWGDPESSVAARCVCVTVVPGHNPGCPVAEYWPDLPPSHRWVEVPERVYVHGRWELTTRRRMIPVPEPEPVAILEATGGELAAILLDLSTGEEQRRAYQRDVDYTATWPRVLALVGHRDVVLRPSSRAHLPALPWPAYEHAGPDRATAIESAEAIADALRARARRENRTWWEWRGPAK